MYLEHFGFSEAPFSIAPDPRYLYLSERHREALAHLLYGIKGDGGFVLLTGEVGTGKTTICRCLLEQIPDDVDVAYIFNPKLTREELLAAICDELRIEYAHDATSTKTFIDLINAYLLQSNACGRKTVLIIDEAQNLAHRVLEQLRLLTNLETSRHKLLQIILVGQPELRARLAEPGLRQLAQRIVARYHLEPLSASEMATYVAHRLWVAGVKRDLFPNSVLQRLYRLTRGTPRLINVICDRALLGTYVHGRERVEPADARQSRKGSPRRRAGAAVVAADTALGDWGRRAVGAGRGPCRGLPAVDGIDLRLAAPAGAPFPQRKQCPRNAQRGRDELMSYILEALKKSEAERQQGKVPDLAAVPVRVLMSPEPLPRFLLLAGAAALVAVGVLLGWWRPWEPALPEAALAEPAMRAEVPTPLPPAQPQSVPVPVAPAPASLPKSDDQTALDSASEASPSGAAPPASAARGEAAPPSTAPAAPPPTPPAEPAQSAAAAPKPPPKAPAVESKPAALRSRPEPAGSPTPKASVRPSPPTPAPVSEGKPPTRILRFSELPPAVARSVPRIKVDGYALTDDPATRIVVINGQMLGEGEQVTADLKLERIGTDGVVLNYKGYRFRPAP